MTPFTLTRAGACGRAMDATLIRVPTHIHFAAENARVTVDEAPEEVAQAFTSAEGAPFRLTRQGGHGAVYVNPSTVAFWTDSDRSSEPFQPEPEPEPPTVDRNTVTDIWGRPLRRNPRR